MTRLDRATQFGNSIRVRLTAWNGFILAVTLLAFAAASYELLAHASLDQVDDGLNLQLRSAQLAIRERARETSAQPAVLAEIVNDLQLDGYRVAVAEGDTAFVVTRATRADRDDGDLPSSGPVEPSRPTVVSDGLRRRIVEHLPQALPFTIRDEHQRVRIRASSEQINGRPVIVAAVASLGDVAELLETVRGLFFVAIPLVVVIAIAIGYALARRALDPVAAMTAEAERIGARTLSERLSVTNPNDELGRLGSAFNAVVDRLDSALEQQRRFTADASHELRTPISVIRAEADVALNATRTASEYHDALTVIRNSSEHLSRIVNDLFLLARADAGQVGLMTAPIYLDELVVETVRTFRSLAATRRVQINVTAPDESQVIGDETLLRRVLVNLLDNALKYAPEGSSIDVAVERDAASYRVSITDVGPGIPSEARSFIFDRFYRADSARVRETSAYGTGAGLGLAIGREIATLHGGTLSLRDGDGPTVFDLRLPAAG